jgi:hypothetical protein
MTFKVGDWVYEDFTLNQIKKMEGTRVTEISDGMFSRSGSDLTCFPLSLRNKAISESFHHYYMKLNDIRGLNFPDIRRYFGNLWEEAMETKNDDAVKEIYNKISIFVNNAIDLSEQRKQTKIQGVDIFR